MASLASVSVLGGLVGAVTGRSAAWAVMAVALALTLVYVGALAHMRRLAEARELSRAFGKHPGWEILAREPALFPDTEPDRVAVVADRPGDVARFIAAWLLAELLTPLIVVIRLVRGSQVEEQGVLGHLVRAREYAQLHSLRVLGMSAVATAGITGGGLAAAGASTVGSHAATAVSASVQAAPARLSASVAAAVTSNVGHYTVRPGDNLYEIAESYGASVASLAKENGIADPNVIVVGDVLRVPLPTYTVGRGDTLGGISRNFGVPVSDLAAANGINDPNTVLVNKVIKVGGGDLPPVQHWSEQSSDPASTDPPAGTSVTDPPAPPLVGSGTYTVRPGDTLLSIARRFDTWTNTLVQANHLNSPNAIVVGQVLQVGGQGANAPVTQTDPPAAKHAVADPARPKAPPLVGSGTYTVRPGDTLVSIALRFDTWTASLVQANHLANASDIKVGQVLQVGGQGANAPRPAADPDDSHPAPVHVAPRPAPAPAAAVAPPTSAFEACVMQRESSGNPNAWNASGHWGLFQFSESTWVEYGGSPAEFGHASAAVQEQVFANAMARGGEFNWAPYDGC